MRNCGPPLLIRLVSLLAIFGLVCPLFGALDIDSLKPEGYLSDYAHTVDASSKQQIEQYCYRVEQSLGVQIGVVTISSLEGRDIETTANQLFRHFGIGSKQGNKGVLLLLAIQDRKSRIEVGYGIEPYLTDGFSGSILRSMRPELQGGNYGAALLDGAHQIGAQVAQGLGQPAPEGTPPVERTVPVRRARPQGGIPFPLIVLGLFFLFWIFGRGGRGRGGRGGGGGGFLPGLILGNMMGGGRRDNWGGGGFGGWDSGGGGGGGFGGFGGGSSGGGGASSDW
jgi:uncharacterized protein